MKNHKIYAIHDMKAETFMQPWFVPTEAVAIRTFAKAANDPNHSIGENPRDYTLVEVGIWDDETGIIDPNKTPRTVATGFDVLKNKIEEED